MTGSEETRIEGIPEDRIRRLNETPIAKDGAYVLVWMQQAQRAEHNLALDAAVRLANRAGLGVLVVFGLTPDYPEATHRAYAFMVEGLREVDTLLQRRGFAFAVVLAEPPEAALRAASSAACLVCDRGYLRHQREWRRRVAQHAPCAVFEVETDAVVPVETASGKAEYAARTLRPKIHRHLDAQPLPGRDARPEHAPPRLPAGLEPYDLRRFPEGFRMDTSAEPVPESFRGGATEARRRLDLFLHESLHVYAERGKRPDAPAVSRLSPYLHFGQISPLEVFGKILQQPDSEHRAGFIEQLCIRRELSNNFTTYTDGYDRYEDAIPEWARKTLTAQADDPRPRMYDGEQLEAARTHDPYWNAMMKCMRATGYLHNHLRMYWGKKVLEWSPTPAEAYASLLRLNNRWFLDGRDPNSYASVAWIFGLHDRPWARRPIYGTVRCMMASGLERAFDIKAWSRDWNKAEERTAARRPSQGRIRQGLTPGGPACRGPGIG